MIASIYVYIGFDLTDPIEVLLQCEMFVDDDSSPLIQNEENDQTFLHTFDFIFLKDICFCKSFDDHLNSDWTINWKVFTIILKIDKIDCKVTKLGESFVVGSH